MAIAPFHWGVHRLKIDQTLLIDGILRVVELEAVLPDGLAVYHASQEGDDLEVELEPYIEEMKQGRPGPVRFRRGQSGGGRKYGRIGDFHPAPQTTTQSPGY